VGGTAASTQSWDKLTCPLQDYIPLIKEDEFSLPVAMGKSTRLKLPTLSICSLTSAYFAVASPFTLTTSVVLQLPVGGHGDEVSTAHHYILTHTDLVSWASHIFSGQGRRERENTSRNYVQLSVPDARM